MLLASRTAPSVASLLFRNALLLIILLSKTTTSSDFQLIQNTVKTARTTVLSTLCVSDRVARRWLFESRVVLPSSCCQGTCTKLRSHCLFLLCPSTSLPSRTCCSKGSVPVYQAIAQPMARAPQDDQGLSDINAKFMQLKVKPQAMAGGIEGVIAQVHLLRVNAHTLLTLEGTNPL